MYVVQQNSAHMRGVYKTMRYVIITGTSQGLGEAIATQLLEKIQLSSLFLEEKIKSLRNSQNNIIAIVFLLLRSSRCT